MPILLERMLYSSNHIRGFSRFVSNFLILFISSCNYIHISRFCIITILGTGVGDEMCYFVCVNKKWKGVNYILPKILTLYIAYFIVSNRDTSQLQPTNHTLHKLTLHRKYILYFPCNYTNI